MATTELPPDPGDENWDDWVDDQMQDVEFDTELAKQMAEDARKIAAGELSKETFHTKYSDAVEEEFGVDERPTQYAVESANSDPMPQVPQTRGRSRRRVLEAIGGVAAAGMASMAGCLGALEEDEADTNSASTDGVYDGEHEDEEGIIDEIPHEKQMGMVVDTEACIACLQCSLACKEENDTDVGVHWPYVFRYEDNKYGDTQQGQLTRHCQHCSEPTCTYVCPTQARYKRTEDGIVLTDYDTCIGCRYCQVSCPYGVNYLGQDEPSGLSDGFDGDPVGRDGRTVAGPPPQGVMGKCTFCVHRQDADDEALQGTTACEEICPANAIHFGDMANPNSDPRQYLRRDDVAEKYHFKLLDDSGNEPNVVFVGQEPSKNAEPIEGPVAYDDKGMVDGDYDHVTWGDDE